MAYELTIGSVPVLERPECVGDRSGMSKDRNLVFVVDDDLGMLRAIKRLLRQYDYNPSCFRPRRLSKTTPISRRRFASFSTST